MIIRSFVGHIHSLSSSSSSPLFPTLGFPGRRVFRVLEEESFPRPREEELQCGNRCWTSNRSQGTTAMVTSTPLDVRYLKSFCIIASLHSSVCPYRTRILELGFFFPFCLFFLLYVMLFCVSIGFVSLLFLAKWVAPSMAELQSTSLFFIESGGEFLRTKARPPCSLRVSGKRRRPVSSTYERIGCRLGINWLELFGASSDTGRRAAEESNAMMEEAVCGADMVFVTVSITPFTWLWRARSWGKSQCMEISWYKRIGCVATMLL